MSAAITDPDSLAADARAARTRLLLTGPVGATLARLAAPNILAMLVSAAMNISEAALSLIAAAAKLSHDVFALPPRSPDNRYHPRLEGFINASIKKCFN